MIEIPLSRKLTKDRVWGRNDYLMEAEMQLSDKKVYQEVSKFIKIKTFYLS